MTIRRATRTRHTRADPVITPLSRNRNYQLLWGSRSLTEFGGSAVAITFPLLALAISGSSATVGFVVGTSAAASLLIGLPGGALVDRWNRKKVMLGCEATGVIASLSLVVALWCGVASVAHMMVVAAISGACGAMFAPAEEACLPNLVPDGQLPTAVSMNEARDHLGNLSGTAVGGFLFTIGAFVPFAMDVLTRVMGFLALLFLRIPPRDVQPKPLSHLGREVASGARWMWRHRPLRVMALFAVGINMFFVAYFIIIIVLAQSRGASAGSIGVMVAMMGAGGILGTLIAPYLYRRLNTYLSIIIVFWAATLLTPLTVFISNSYLMGMLLAAIAFLFPTANTAIATYQLLVTPDGLRGRMSSVMGAVMGSAAVAGPAFGGVILEVVSDNQAVLLCAAGIGVGTVLGTISPTLRNLPRRAVVGVVPTVVQEHGQQVEF